MTYVNELGCFIQGVEDLAVEVGGDIEKVIKEEMEGIKDVAQATMGIVNTLMVTCDGMEISDIQEQLKSIKSNLSVLL